MFDFHDIVTVLKCDKFPEVVNQQGYIAGKSFSEEDEHGDPVEGSAVTGYGVLLFGPEKVYFFLPDAIKATGYVLATRTDERGNVVPIGSGEA
jgi:hypothetical protein